MAGRPLADAGYRKLITRVRGSDLDVALREAAEAAAGAVAEEISLTGQKSAEQVVGQINAAFGRGKRALVPLPPGQLTMLEALQAGIAGQLSALDAGQPGADLGMPVSVVADGLTGHLLREIMVRGARGGPLTALAGQLNSLSSSSVQPIRGILLPCHFHLSLFPSGDRPDLSSVDDRGGPVVEPERPRGDGALP